MSRFSDIVFSQPRGLAVEFDQLAAGGRWRQAIASATALLEADPERMDATRRAQLYASVAQLARGLLAANRPDEARQFIASSVAQFGANDDLLRLATRVASQSGQSQRGAIDYLLGLYDRRSTYFEIDRSARRRPGGCP